ncbi:MAG: TasA family protein, partial [Methanocellales archaeon]|nr:TasA family protein [Methanocellales archaeon]
TGGATFAYFSDTETSTGNTFTAGTLDLKLDEGDDNVVKFKLADLKPGDSGVGTWALRNAGSIPGYLDLESISVVDDPGTTPESEPTPDNGELGANMDVVLFWDDGAGNGIAGNGIQDGTEATIYSGKLASISVAEQNYPLAAGATTYISLTWSIGSGVGNEIQGDISTLNITFELAQTTGQ